MEDKILEELKRELAEELRKAEFEYSQGVSVYEKIFQEKLNEQLNKKVGYKPTPKTMDWDVMDTEGRRFMHVRFKREGSQPKAKPPLESAIDKAVKELKEL